MTRLVIKILITGGSGFIGKNLIKNLISDPNVKIMSFYNSKYPLLRSKNLKWIKVDLMLLKTYKRYIKEFKPDLVFHLAWEGIPFLNEKFSIKNLKQSKLFLNFILNIKYCKKIIVSGSCLEYANLNGPLREKNSLDYKNFFPKAKNNLMNWLMKKSKQKIIKVAWFRIFYVYGPGQRKNSLIPYLIHCLKSNDKPDIKNPYNCNDFIYIDDVISLLKKSIFINFFSGVYNVGSNNSVSTNEIIKTVQKSINTKTNNIKISIKNDHQENIINFWSDINKTRKQFNWSPNISIKTGIKKMIKASK